MQHTVCVCVQSVGTSVANSRIKIDPIARRRRVCNFTHNPTITTTNLDRFCSGTSLVPNPGKSNPVWYQSGTTLGGGDRGGS